VVLRLLLLLLRPKRRLQVEVVGPGDWQRCLRGIFVSSTKDCVRNGGGWVVRNRQGGGCVVGVRRRALWASWYRLGASVGGS